MNPKKLLGYREKTLRKMTKSGLVKTYLSLRDALTEEIKQQAKTISIQAKKIEHLQIEQDAAKTQKVNNTANQPTSKKPEFDKDGKPLKHNKNNKKKKRKKRKKRPGSGNKNKSDLVPDETNHTPLDDCPDCGKDLSKREGTTKPPRIVEDIAPPRDKTIVSAEVEESKWCPKCQKMVSSKSERALPGSDIGPESWRHRCGKNSWNDISRSNDRGRLAGL